MSVYTYGQMEYLWIQAGGPKALAPIAAAIGEAESGGESTALNDHDNNGTQSSYGIWQISNGTHSPPSPNWANPAVNAQLAVGKWKGAGRSFSPWGTYTSGAYKAFLSGKVPPDPNVPGDPGQHIAETAAQQSIDCIFGGYHFGVFFGHGPSLPCLFTKSNARGFIGVGLMISGASILFPGVMLLAIGAASKVAAPVANAVGSVPVVGTYTRAATGAVTARARASGRQAGQRIGTRRPREDQTAEAA